MLPQSALGVKQDEVPALPPLSGFYLAQVVTPLPIDHALEVILPSLSGILNGSSSNALKVHVMEHRAGPYHGDLDLPRKGDWGIVVFPHGSDLHPVWLGSLYQDFNSLATANEQEKISHHDSGIWTKTDKDGNYEFAYPDGSYLRIGSGTALSGRTRQRRQGSARENLSYSVPSKPAPTVYFKQSTGTAITIDPAGNITLSGSAEVTVESQVSGPHVHIGGAVAEDFVGKLAGMAKIVATFNSHTHPGITRGLAASDPPSTPITLLPATDYSTNAKVS